MALTQKYDNMKLFMRSSNQTMPLIPTASPIILKSAIGLLKSAQGPGTPRKSEKVIFANKTIIDFTNFLFKPTRCMLFSRPAVISSIMGWRRKLPLATLILIIMITASTSYAESKRKWATLEKDGLHDPSNPAINELQQPAEALSMLVYDYTGNKVRWVAALQKRQITPRASIKQDSGVPVLDLDIIMDKTGGMPMVRFPHRPHTEWLDCVNCHDELFYPEVDKNPINMTVILQGEYCGRCHGAVAFPLTECNRCHSVARNLYVGTLGAQYENMNKQQALQYLEWSRKQSALELLPNRIGEQQH